MWVCVLHYIYLPPYWLEVLNLQARGASLVVGSDAAIYGAPSHVAPCMIGYLCMSMGGLAAAGHRGQLWFGVHLLVEPYNVLHCRLAFHAGAWPLLQVLLQRKLHWGLLMYLGTQAPYVDNAVHAPSQVFLKVSQLGVLLAINCCASWWKVEHLKANVKGKLHSACVHGRSGTMVHMMQNGMHLRPSWRRSCRGPCGCSCLWRPHGFYACGMFKR